MNTTHNLQHGSALHREAWDCSWCVALAQDTLVQLLPVLAVLLIRATCFQFGTNVSSFETGVSDSSSKLHTLQLTSSRMQQLTNVLCSLSFITAQMGHIATV